MPGLYAEVAQDMHVIHLYAYLAVSKDDIIIIVTDRRTLLSLICLHVVYIENESLLTAAARRLELLPAEATDNRPIIEQHQEQNVWCVIKILVEIPIL